MAGAIRSIPRAATAAGPEGLIADDLAFVKPWGVDLSDVRIPVLLAHGGDDRIVPPSHSQWLLEQLPNAELWTRPQRKHFGHGLVAATGRNALRCPLAPTRTRAGLTGAYELADKTGAGGYGIVNDAVILWQVDADPIILCILTRIINQHAEGNNEVIAEKPRLTRTIQFVLAWAVGVIGTITTAISLIPAVAVIASVSRVSSLGFAAVLLVVSVMYLTVPIFIALAIANTGPRWWLWLTIAIAVIVFILVARFAVGSLDVYWMRF